MLAAGTARHLDIFSSLSLALRPLCTDTVTGVGPLAVTESRCGLRAVDEEVMRASSLAIIVLTETLELAATLSRQMGASSRQGWPGLARLARLPLPGHC